VELSFATTGTIPPGGITAVLEITDPDLFNQISRPSNANSTGITIPAGSRTTITDADGKFVKVLQRVTITGANATLRLPVLEDILQEADKSYAIKLVDGEGYGVDAAANTASFTLTDGTLPAVVPTVSIASTPGTLYESEQSILTLTFTTTGVIPEGGLEVFLDSGVLGALGEFDVQGRAQNPSGIVGPQVTGGTITGTDNDVSGVFFKITAATATIKVPVFKDTEAEGPETLTFTLAEGEAYNVRPDRSSVTVRIEDTIEPPVVTMTGSPALLKESDGSVLELSFATTGTIPPGGITAILEITDPLLLGDQISRPSSANSTGITIPAGSRQTITDANGNFVKILQRITITDANATLRMPVVNDILQETDKSYSIKLIDSDGYNLDAAAANTANFTVSDGTIPAVVPTVSVTATPTALFESEQTAITLTFATTGTIPTGGLQVFLDSGVFASLGEFDVQGRAQNPGGVVGPQITGGAIVGTDNDVSGVFLRLDANTTTLTIPVFQDDEAEGTETFTYRLIEGEAYDVSASQGAFTVSIADTRPGGNDSRDVLTGTIKSESLTGLGGRDTITTGAGNDLIVYTSVRDGLDTITDFTVGSDKFDIRQIMRGQNLSLSYADTVAQGYLKFGSSGADGVVQFDLDGNAGPNRAISLALVTGKSATDLNQAQNFLLA
jgi:large repetitive protein